MRNPYVVLTIGQKKVGSNPNLRLPTVSVQPRYSGHKGPLAQYAEFSLPPELLDKLETWKGITKIDESSYGITRRRTLEVAIRYINRHGQALVI